MSKVVHPEPSPGLASNGHPEASPSGSVRFPWIDPTLGYPDDTLIEGVWKLDKARYVAVRGAGAHKSMPWMEACHSSGLERVDGHSWELFTADKAGTVAGRDWLWGMFVEGIGAFNVMVPAAWSRDLTDAERAYYSGRRMGMYSGYGGDLSYTLNLPSLAASKALGPLDRTGGQNTPGITTKSKASQ